MAVGFVLGGCQRLQKVGVLCRRRDNGKLYYLYCFTMVCNWFNEGTWDGDGHLGTLEKGNRILVVKGRKVATWKIHTQMGR